MSQEMSIVTAYTQIPYSVFATELQGSFKSEFNAEISEILNYYNIYEKGAEFSSEGTGGDYVASDVRYKKARDLIDKESRFLFSIPPTFTVNPDRNGLSEQEKDDNTVLNESLNKVLSKIQFNADLVKAARDCFIGKRVACMLNFNELEGISATFLNATEFLYEFNVSKFA